MPCVITLIADPDKEKLSPVLVSMAAHAFSMQGIEVIETRWIKDNTACEMITNHDPRAAMHEILRGYNFDAIVAPSPRPQYKLFVADMESTIIENECLDELAEYIGAREKISAITKRAMNGELDFAAALAERVALLGGLPESVLEEVYDKKVRLMPGAEELMRALKAKGIYTMLVSGGFSFYTTRIAKRLGFDEERSNKLEIIGGKLTGKVIAPILDRNAKLAALEEGCAKLGISPAQAIAIGDGANDLPMLLAAGLGIAYHAKPTVRAQAKAQINHCDLSALKFLLSS